MRKKNQIPQAKQDLIYEHTALIILVIAEWSSHLVCPEKQH